jgi:hypothetical protein
MAYLIPADYLRIIQDANLQQIITSNPAVQHGVELAAQAEAISYLRQKYDVAVEFTDTNLWDRTAPYKAGDRVYLNAAAYSISKVYALKDLVLQSGGIYECILVGSAGAFVPANWNFLGLQYDVFYARNPYPLFNLAKLYNKGDMVYWAGNVYTCLIQTPVISHEDGIQYYQTNQIPYANIFPDDTVQGPTHWAFNYNYIVPAQTAIDDAATWAATDNRDQQMVMYFADITLYHLHARIAPRNIPELRVARYDAAIDWLKMCAKGDITPNLPLLQPKQGGRIRFGSQIRNINSY